MPDEPFAAYLYSFSIIIINERTPVGGDPRVEATVIHVLNYIFAANPQFIINYVCSLEDDLERSRRILFGHWFRHHGAGYSRLAFTDAESRIYAAVVFQTGHLHQATIEMAFDREYRAK